MSNKQTNWRRITDSKIIAILRCENGDQLLHVAEALHAGGIDAIEITFTVPNALQIIETVADQLGDKILLGAGTVLDAETARSAMLAGAQFFVSPGISCSMIEMCRRYDKLVFPGALTPTEIMTAWEMGCDAIKIFPSDVGGPKHLKALKAPFPQIPMVPTGGINDSNINQFFAAGAIAVGAGGSLAPKSAIESGDFDLIRKNAESFMNALTN